MSGPPPRAMLYRWLASHESGYVARHEIADAYRMFAGWDRHDFTPSRRRKVQQCVQRLTDRGVVRKIGERLYRITDRAGLLVLADHAESTAPEKVTA